MAMLQKAIESISFSLGQKINLPNCESNSYVNGGFTKIEKHIKHFTINENINSLPDGNAHFNLNLTSY
jgi:hypothetical protein